MTNDDRIEFLLQSAASHDRQLGEVADAIGELKEAIGRQAANIERLIVASAQDAENIRALARIAEAHQNRIEGLEGRA